MPLVGICLQNQWNFTPFQHLSVSGDTQIRYIKIASKSFNLYLMYDLPWLVAIFTVYFNIKNVQKTSKSCHEKYFDKNYSSSMDIYKLRLTLKVLIFWKFTSYYSIKPLSSGMRDLVPARTLLTLHPPSPPTVHQLSWLALQDLSNSRVQLKGLQKPYCGAKSPNLIQHLTHNCQRCSLHGNTCSDWAMCSDYGAARAHATMLT